MRPSLVIPHLKATCPVFENRVAGSASYEQAIAQYDFPVPHAIVLLGPEGDGEAPALSALDQEMTLAFAIVVTVSNSADDRGQAAAEQIFDIRAELLAAMVAWTPDTARYAPVRYLGMPDDPEMNRSRLHARLDFQTVANTASAA